METNSLGNPVSDDYLKKKITEILLEDPNSDIRILAETYLTKCLEKATEDPENNPILFEFYGKYNKELESIKEEINELREEIKHIRSIIDSDYQEIQVLDKKLFNLLGHLRMFKMLGINIDYGDL